jgi:uncharacterized protein with FMN-binding domain
MTNDPGFPMKKIILSLAVLAASGAYVVLERQYNDAANFSTGLPPIGSDQGGGLPPLPDLGPAALVTPDANPPAGLVPIAFTTPSPADTAAPPTAPAPLTQAAAAQLRDGTYKGSSEDAYWGRVQVQAIVQGGKLTSVKMIDYPHDRRRSAYISQQVLPTLQQEAISGQSSRVDIFSGATLTCMAFQLSLGNALRQAGGSGGNA